MIRPPIGRCAFIIATAWCAHRYEPVRLVARIDCHPSGVSSSTAPAGAPVPALLTSRSPPPNRSPPVAAAYQPLLASVIVISPPSPDPAPVTTATRSEVMIIKVGRPARRDH